jgi:DNA-binding NarL/FixJ family response regulator
LLWAVVAGWKKDDIAGILGMPTSRIRNTVDELCKKLGVGAKTDLVNWAHNVGIHA